MNLITHQRSEGLVDELMPGNRPFALKFSGHDQRGIVGVVVALDAHDRVLESGFNELCDFRWVHLGLKAHNTPENSGVAKCNRKGAGIPNARARLCIIAGPCRSATGPSHINSQFMLGNIGYIVAGLLLLIWGADRFVHGAAATARNLGIAPLLIGLTIVAFATSAPEILVAVVAAVRGEPGLAIGNAIGSNIVNIGLVLGVTAVIRPISLESATLRREMPALLAVSLLTVSLFLDQIVSQVDGVVMLTGLVIVMFWLARLGLRSAENDPIAQDYEAEIPSDVSMPMAVVWIVVGLGVLLLGADWLVEGSIGVAKILGVSEVVIGITIVAFGTSLPELAVSLVSALKGEYGLAIGNIVGSNIFNLLAVIGVAAAIHPTTIAPTVLSLHIFVMAAFTLVLFAMTYDYDGKGQLTRLEGLALVMAYGAYTAYVVMQNI